MTLYLVHGNTWFEGYGYEERVFGVFTSREKAEEARIVSENKICKEYEDYPDYLHIDIHEHIGLEILELKSDEFVDLELGGYIE